jgi:hypothetical protein
MTAAADKKAASDKAVADAKAKAAAKKADNSESNASQVNDIVNERAGKTDHTHVDEPVAEPSEEEIKAREEEAASQPVDANFHLGASSIDVPDEAKIPEVGWSPPDANDSFNQLWVEINDELEDGVAKDQVLNAFTTVQTRFREVQTEHKARRDAKAASDKEHGNS